MSSVGRDTVVVETVLQQCLARLPEAHAVVCVSLGDRRVIASANLSDDTDDHGIEQLAAAAADLFRSGPIMEDPAISDGAASEALVTGQEQALIFLKGRERPDIAVAYRLNRSAALGLALATSRQTVADIEAAL